MGKKFWGLLLSGIPLLCSAGKMLLEFFGDIDFIVGRIQDPGWMRDAYVHIVSFSPVGNMLIFIILLCLFAYFIKYSKNE
ncbi:MAG: hypothetical protein ABI618_07280, partial [Nitrospirota bacterium]